MGRFYKIELRNQPLTTARTGQEFRRQPITRTGTTLPYSHGLSNIGRGHDCSTSRIRVWNQLDRFVINGGIIKTSCGHRNNTCIADRNRLHILCGLACRFAAPSISSRQHRARLINFGDRSATSGGSQNDFRHLGSLGVILIRRQRHGSQNADDRHDDHQFDQRETLLNSLHVASCNGGGDASAMQGPCQPGITQKRPESPAAARLKRQESVLGKPVTAKKCHFAGALNRTRHPCLRG